MSRSGVIRSIACPRTAERQRRSLRSTKPPARRRIAGHFFCRTANTFSTWPEPIETRRASSMPSTWRRSTHRHAASIGDTRDIWIYDPARGSRTRFTTDPMNDYAGIWSPDGKQIVFASDRNIGESLFIKDVDGFTHERLLQSMKGSFLIASDW